MDEVTKPLTVSELNRRIKRTLEGRFPDVHLEAELGEVSRPSSGHVYLKLKDAQSEIAAVLWKDRASKLAFDLEVGLQVVVQGPVRVYHPKGRFQVEIRRIVPHGVGALDLAFRQLYDRLKKEGLFDPEQKKELPRFPTRVGLVTSPSGAAIEDMLRVLLRRAPRLKVLVQPVRVQGAGAAQEIAEGIERLNRLVPQLDLMIVGRGGGSLEDLWAFNEEEVARAIHASEIPVISAVGHEVDRTIADFVADLRAQTPTEAGELAVPDEMQIRKDLTRLGRSLQRALLHRVERARGKLEVLRVHPVLQKPLDLVHERSQMVDELAQALPRALRHVQVEARSRLLGLANRPVLRRPLEWVRDRVRLVREGGVDLERSAHRFHKRAGERLTALEGRLASLSPVAVLQRGYSLTTKEDGSVVRSVDELRVGNRIRTRVAEGQIQSVVEATQSPSVDSVSTESETNSAIREER